MKNASSKLSSIILKTFLIYFIVVSNAYAQNLGRVKVPKEIETQIIRSQDLGKKIYEYDRASAAATDILLSKKLLDQDKNIKGWVTVERADSWLVRFVNDKKLAKFDVTLPKGAFEKGTLQINESGKSLTSYEAKMFEARQTALKETFQRCSENFNTVVLDAKLDNKKGFLVYLLAASKSVDDVYFGGNHLFSVSADGKKIVGTRAFSKSCVTVSKKNIPRDQQSKGLYITHVLNDFPTEVHVFLSYSHKSPIYVGTNSFLWLVDENIISAVEKR